MLSNSLTLAVAAFAAKPRLTGNDIVVALSLTHPSCGHEQLFDKLLEYFCLCGHAPLVRFWKGFLFLYEAKDFGCLAVLFHRRSRYSWINDSSQVVGRGYRGTPMSLIHYVKPFLELGICKEYCMAHKTTGNTTKNRSKKTATSAPPAAVQVAPEISRNGKPVNVVLGNVPADVPVNLEEEIRRRAYELYLQRRATAGDVSGNEDQDWLIAEREVRSRHGRLARHTTA